MDGNQGKHYQMAGESDFAMNALRTKSNFKCAVEWLWNTNTKMILFSEIFSHQTTEDPLKIAYQAVSSDEIKQVISMDYCYSEICPIKRLLTLSRNTKCYQDEAKNAN